MNLQDNYTKRNQSNSIGVMIWSVLWGVTLMIAGAATSFFAPLTSIFIAALIVVHLLVAFMALKAHLVWLKQLDEYQKQVQLNSIAFTVGIAWIAIFLMILLDFLGLTEIGIKHLVFLSVLMGTIGAISTVVNLRKTS